MGILGKLLIAILVLVAAVVVIGFFLPRDVHVEREIVIDAPPSTIYSVVYGFTRFDEWSPWAERDPNTQYTFEGPSHGVGAKMSWQSDDPNVGSGSQEITAVVPNEEVRSALDFGDQGTADAFFRFSDAEGGGTRVVWGFDTDMGMNPIGRWFGLFMDGMLGPDYEKGLQNLKTLAESLPVTDIADLEAEVVTLEAQPLAYVERTTSLEPAAISAALGEAYGRISAFLGEHDLAASGAPVAIHHSWDEEAGEYSFAAGIPFSGEPGEITEDSDVQIGETRGGKALKVVHTGAYHRLSETYEKGQAYLALHDWEMDGDAWDAYADDPTTKPEEEVVTHVFFPLVD